MDRIYRYTDSGCTGGIVLADSENSAREKLKEHYGKDIDVWSIHDDEYVYGDIIEVY